MHLSVCLWVCVVTWHIINVCSNIHIIERVSIMVYNVPVFDKPVAVPSSLLFILQNVFLLLKLELNFSLCSSASKRDTQDSFSVNDVRHIFDMIGT